MAGVQAVPAARVVQVAPALVVREPVVGGVIDTAEGQRRPHVVALSGVVVDHVEDDLDARLVQRLHHRLELADLLAALARRGVPVVRGQEADRVVAPVVGQAAGDQELLGHELVHRHELHRGDPEPLQVRDHRRVGEPGVGAALRRRDLRMAQGQPAHVRLVDDGLVVGGLRGPVVAPVEERVDDHVLRHVRRAVRGVPLPGVGELVVEQRLVPADLTLDRLAVRVEQQLGAIAAPPARGVVRPVHPVAVPLPGRDTGQVAVPHEAVDLGQLDPGLAERAATVVGLVEQAELYAFSDLGEKGEVRAPSVPCCTKRVWRSRPDTHSPPFGGQSGRVRPAADSTGSAYARRDVRYRIVTSGSGFLGFLEGYPEFYPDSRVRFTPRCAELT